jgi:hypothetical protein
MMSPDSTDQDDFERLIRKVKFVHLSDLELSGHLTGVLQGSTLARVEAHLKICRICSMRRLYLHEVNSIVLQPKKAEDRKEVRQEISAPVHQPGRPGWQVKPHPSVSYERMAEKIKGLNNGLLRLKIPLGPRYSTDAWTANEGNFIQDFQIGHVKSEGVTWDWRIDSDQETGELVIRISSPDLELFGARLQLWIGGSKIDTLVLDYLTVAKDQVGASYTFSGVDRLKLLQETKEIHFELQSSVDEM